jgi:uncharacterized damage-inducible protein DinB
MIFQQPIEQLFSQLNDVISRLSNEAYSRPGQQLLDSSIGKHVRHIIEMFICLEEGYSQGIINYEKRRRDNAIEINKELAMQHLSLICANLVKPDKSLLLETEVETDVARTATIETSYYRELAYNIEHCVHHMAMIRIGLHEIARIKPGDDFGFAFSTIKHRRQCAQ